MKSKLLYLLIVLSTLSLGNAEINDESRSDRESGHNSSCNVFQKIYDFEELNMLFKGPDEFSIQLKDKTLNVCLMKEVKLTLRNEGNSSLSLCINSTIKSVKQDKRKRNILNIIIASTIAGACFITLCLLIGILRRHRHLQKLDRMEEKIEPNIFEEINLSGNNDRTVVDETVPVVDDTIAVAYETSHVRQNTFFSNNDPPPENEMVLNTIYEQKHV